MPNSSDSATSARSPLDSRWMRCVFLPRGRRVDLDVAVERRVGVLQAQVALAAAEQRHEDLRGSSRAPARTSRGTARAPSRRSRLMAWCSDCLRLRRGRCAAPTRKSRRCISSSCSSIASGFTGAELLELAAQRRPPPRAASRSSTSTGSNLGEQLVERAPPLGLEPLADARRGGPASSRVPQLGRVQLVAERAVRRRRTSSSARSASLQRRVGRDAPPARRPRGAPRRRAASLSRDSRSSAHAPSARASSLSALARASTARAAAAPGAARRVVQLLRRAGARDPRPPAARACACACSTCHDGALLARRPPAGAPSPSSALARVAGLAARATPPAPAPRPPAPRVPRARSASSATRCDRRPRELLRIAELTLAALAPPLQLRALVVGAPRLLRARPSTPRRRPPAARSAVASAARAASSAPDARVPPRVARDASCCAQLGQLGAPAQRAGAGRLCPAAAPRRARSTKARALVRAPRTSPSSARTHAPAGSAARTRAARPRASTALPSGRVAPATVRLRSWRRPAGAAAARGSPTACQARTRSPTSRVAHDDRVHGSRRGSAPRARPHRCRRSTKSESGPSTRALAELLALLEQPRGGRREADAVALERLERVDLALERRARSRRRERAPRARRPRRRARRARPARAASSSTAPARPARAPAPAPRPRRSCSRRDGLQCDRRARAAPRRAPSRRCVTSCSLAQRRARGRCSSAARLLAQLARRALGLLHALPRGGDGAPRLLLRGRRAAPAPPPRPRASPRAARAPRAHARAPPATRVPERLALATLLLRALAARRRVALALLGHRHLARGCAARCSRCRADEARELVRAAPRRRARACCATSRARSASASVASACGLSSSRSSASAHLEPRQLVAPRRHLARRERRARR